MALAFALPLAAVGVTQDASPRKTPAVAVHSESVAAVPQTRALPAPVQIAQGTAVPRQGTQRPANEPGPAAIVPATADTSITGDWRGSINLAGRPGRFVLHIAYAGATLTATFDSPDVAILGGKVDAITLAGPTLRFAIQYPDVSFSGDLSSNEKIVGTLVRGGTSFPMVLTRTIDPPVQSQIFTRPSRPVAGSVYHHDRSDIEFTLPAGWSVGQLETATNDPGEMAVLINPDHKPVSATVWMFRVETHPQDIPGWLDASLKRKLASRAGKTGAVIEATIDGYRVRPGSEQHTTVNGYQSLWAIGEFGEAKDAGTELLVFVCGEHGRVYFDLRGNAPQIAAVQPAFEELISLSRSPEINLDENRDMRSLTYETSIAGVRLPVFEHGRCGNCTNPPRVRIRIY
jgi:hypothetical protein